MSRTKRRTNGCTGYIFDNYYKPHESCEYVSISKHGWSFIKTKIILSEKQTDKKLAKYHSDHGRGYYTNRCKWGRNEERFRSHCKQEIVKFIQQEDHPVQIQTKRFLRGWWNWLLNSLKQTTKVVTQRWLTCEEPNLKYKNFELVFVSRLRIQSVVTGSIHSLNWFAKKIDYRCRNAVVLTKRD